MENVSPLIRRQFSVDQPHGNLYPYLPKDMIVFILSHLPSFNYLCNFSQACTNLEPIRKEDGLWGMLFKRLFPHLSHVVPTQSWFDLCQTEYRWIRNVIKENYALQSFLVEGTKISCLTLTDNGCVVVGNEDGSIRMLDPMTGESVLLEGCSKSEKIFELDCKGRFLLIKCKNACSVWDLIKSQEISIPYGEKGFPKKVLNGALSHEGQLFARFIKDLGDDKDAIWVWDLKQPEEAPWGCEMDKCPMPLEPCGRTLVFTNPENSEINILNLDTKKHQTFLDVLASAEIYHDGSPPEIDSVDENRFFSRRGRPHALQHRPIFVWDLRDEKPVPCKVISLTNKGHSFHVIWDAATQPQNSWTENVKMFSEAFPLNSSLEPSLLFQEDSNAFPLCSFPELSLLFQKYIFEPDVLVDRWKDPVWSKMHPGGMNLPRSSPCVAFQNGKFFCPTPDFKSIRCVDFAASDWEMLQDIAKALEDEKNDPLEALVAQDRLKRMPEPIQEAIYQHLFAAMVVAQSAQPDKAIDLSTLTAAAIRTYLENFKK